MLRELAYRDLVVQSSQFHGFTRQHWDLVLLCEKVDKLLQKFDWEEFYGQLEHFNPFVSSASHLPLFNALTGINNSDKCQIKILVLQNIEEIILSIRKEKRKTIRKLTEPFVPSWDQ